jgi:hypothetical protein
MSATDEIQARSEAWGEIAVGAWRALSLVADDDEDRSLFQRVFRAAVAMEAQHARSTWVDEDAEGDE